VPEEVKSIASYAFLNCPIRISLSNNVTDIGTGAFKGCEFSYFYIPNKVSTIEDFTFFECKNLTTIVLNNNITSIGMSAFLGCSSLSNIELPSNLSNIEMGAFEKCEKLKSISIPNNVKSINESTFQECTALENITLGKNISFIRSQAFLGCEKLSQIYCKSQTPPSITSNNCFSQYSCTVYVPIGCRDKYVNSPIWNKFANIIEKDF
ncbi:leucine-rich repeat domain-containing protein, partial [Bacteroides acidifaciens]